MGGKSSSSATTQTQTIQTDERIAATDSAFVVTGSDNTLTDHGAIDKAGELSFEAINTLGQVALQSLTQTQTTVDTLGQSADRAFEFVDEQNRDEGSRTLTEIMPWLMAGVAVMAISGSISIRK